MAEARRSEAAGAAQGDEASPAVRDDPRDGRPDGPADRVTPSRGRPGRVFVVVLSGLSGSGKTTALHALEDAGFFCIDNLPSALVKPFLRLSDENPAITRVALSIDVRERLFEKESKEGDDELGRDASASRAAASLFNELDELERQGRLSVLYLESDVDALVNRFKTTRRPHPLMARGSSITLTEALAHERELLEPFRARATLVIDTTDINVHELRRRIIDAYGEAGHAALRVAITSFGFKNGLPPEADFVFDARFLDNPFFRPELRHQTGLDPAVSEFVLNQPAAMALLDRLASLIELVLPLVEAEGRAALTLAIGCTGGQHRSVALAVALRERLAHRGTIALHHRDLPRIADAHG